MSVKDTAGAESPDSIEDRLPAIYRKQTAFRLAGPLTSCSDTKPPVSERQREVRTAMRNPFKLPEGNIFLLRNKENEQRKLEHQRQQILKVHEKSTYAGRIQAKQANLRQELRQGQDEMYPTSSSKAVSTLRDDPAWRKAAILRKQTAFRLAGPLTSCSDTKPPVSERQREVRTAMRNPSKLPADNIFLLRNKENEQRKLEHQRQQILKDHEKSTYAGRIQAKQANLRQELRQGQDEMYPTSSSKAVSTLRDDPAWRKAAVLNSNDRENISEYITKKREMFLTEYSLAVKREVIHKMAEVATKEENRMQQAETFLDEDTAMFDGFLEENDKNSVEAIKGAEHETKAKLEKVAEIKRISGKMLAVKSDIVKNEEILKEFTLYNGFLLKLSPKDWQERQKARRAMVDKIKAAIKEREAQRAEPVKPGRRRVNMARDLPPVCDPRTPQRQSMMRTKESIKRLCFRKKVTVPVDESKLPEYEEPELYFTDPQQLLDLLADLEKQNLILIQNSRETEETMEEFNHTMDNTLKKMDQETEQLTQQIDVIVHAIQREKDMAAELELKSRLFSFGKYKADDQDVMLEALGRKVAEVYRSYVGKSGANLTMLQMLTNIEGRMGELLENMELVPKDRMHMAERAREKERRRRLREEKVCVQKMQQEERLRKALARAQRDTKRPTGKKLMPRSLPPVTERLVNNDDGDIDMEMEKQLYFFT
ncbi:cilia- and flagella-associated protein 100 isoform X2 [Coregonus clupeaformis]|nr:cilia- and flagella-associated protein 100 isoform X2 [Coregonus clupeaformis]XP_041701365.1 cilia- and flagella-associated protein 100 isoform X2 [Coregonus clupeaformis]